MENESLEQIFNTIVESIDAESEFNHDRYFRYAFANPERTAELLTIFSKNNESLKRFLETVDLSSLKGAPENFSMSKHTGSADLVFEARLKTGETADLLVGLIAEHKSFKDSGVFDQLSEYYHHLFQERGKDYPVVAFIVYNGEEDWAPQAIPRYENYPEYYQDIGYPFKVEFLDIGHGLDLSEYKGVSPMTLVALTAMKYIFSEEEFPVTFQQAALHLLKVQNTDAGKEFIKQTLAYFAWKWPYKPEVVKVDRPEIVAANKKGESFAEHYIGVGEKRGALRRAQEIARRMLAKDRPVSEIVEFTGLEEVDVLALKNLK